MSSVDKFLEASKKSTDDPEWYTYGMQTIKIKPTLEGNKLMLAEKTRNA